MVHIATLVFATLLTLAAAIDIRTLRIPDALNALIVALGLAATWALQRPLSAALIGVAAGYAFLFAANFAYRTARGRDGIGLGDAKLLAGAGAWLGWSGLPFVVLFGSALGLAFVAALRLGGRSLGRQDALAFGPFLCAGAFVVWLAQAYVQL